MPQFSKKSAERLVTCHPELQRLFNEVIKHQDCTVTEGHRGEDLQNEYLRTGKSKLPWPQGKHNTLPSQAVDCIPYPFAVEDWKDTRRLYMFVGLVRGIASQLGIRIRCGADWDGDFDLKDQNFHDLPHFELVDVNPNLAVADSGDQSFQQVNS